MISCNSYQQISTIKAVSTNNLPVTLKHMLLHSLQLRNLRQADIAGAAAAASQARTLRSGRTLWLSAYIHSMRVDKL